MLVPGTSALLHRHKTGVCLFVLHAGGFRGFFSECSILVIAVLILLLEVRRNSPVLN